ncbi:MAG: hypothetical protein JWQ38_3109 [Flavipsychrobacter sp.]|nr:hypothetical protein [Flavipsychrobacter sp.]
MFPAMNSYLASGALAPFIVRIAIALVTARHEAVSRNPGLLFEEALFFD